MYFQYFVIISPWERARSFIWTNLKSLHQRMFCDIYKVCLILALWFRRRFFFQFSLFFHYIYLPLEKGVALHLNNLEFPSPKNALCHVSLKLDQWFWRKIFLNFINVFSLFHNYLPSEKGRVLHLNKLGSPFE